MPRWSEGWTAADGDRSKGAAQSPQVVSTQGRSDRKVGWKAHGNVEGVTECPVLSRTADDGPSRAETFARWSGQGETDEDHRE